MPSSDSPLAAMLGADLPPSVAALAPEVHQDLADQLSAARKAQSNALEASITSALKAVPLPLRGVVKKVLLG